MLRNVGIAAALGALVAGCFPGDDDDGSATDAVTDTAVGDTAATDTSGGDTTVADTAAPNDTEVPNDTTGEDDTTTTADTTEATDTGEPGDTTVADVDDTADTTSPPCAGGTVRFVWGDDDGEHDESYAYAPIQVTPIGGSQVTAECPDDWFDATFEAALTDAESSVTLERPKGDTAWAGFRADFVASGTVYDYIYIDHGALPTARFEVTSSTGETKTWNVRAVTPGEVIDVGDTVEAITMLTQQTFADAVRMSFFGVGQELRVERIRFKFDEVGTWSQWYTGADDFDGLELPSAPGDRAGDIEIINTCSSDAYKYHYTSSQPLWDWSNSSGESHDGWFEFTQHPDGSVARGVNVFGATVTTFFPAYTACDVDVTVRLRATKIENQ